MVEGFLDYSNPDYAHVWRRSMLFRHKNREKSRTLLLIMEQAGSNSRRLHIQASAGLLVTTS